MSTTVKIYYAEDSEDDAFFMARAVAKSGLPIDLVVWPDGTAIIEALKTDAPDVIVLDIQMPGATGLEVLKWINSTDCPAKGRPKVIFSSSSLSSDTEEARRLGANAFMNKGGNGEEWVAVVSRIYALAQNAKAGDPSSETPRSSALV